MNLPIVMLSSNVESHSTVMRSENCPHGRSFGSHATIMEFIPNSLVGQVNLSSPAEVNVQGSNCTNVIAERQQDKKKVLSWGFHPVMVLILSPGVLSRLLVTSQ